MTKVRAPLTFELAILRIVGLIGWDGAAGVTGKSESLMRKVSDQEHPTQLTYEDALKLDVAYRAAGGAGAPLHDCYALRLRAETAIATADSIELARKAGRAAKEAGEALGALIQASQPGATDADRAIAARETEECIAALAATLPHTAAGAGTGVSLGRE